MSWLDSLLDPAPLVAGARNLKRAPTHRESLAFLLDGRAEELDRIRSRRGGEGLVELRREFANPAAARDLGPEPLANAAERRLVALGVSVVSGFDVGPELLLLAGEPSLPLDLRTTAWAIARVAAPAPWGEDHSLANAAPDSWLRDWRELGAQLADEDSPVAAVALTHLSVREFDGGRLAEASELTERAEALLAHAASSGTTRLLRVVNRDNRDYLRWARGHYSSSGDRDWSKLPPAWFRSESRALPALQAHIDAAFAAATTGRPTVIGSALSGDNEEESGRRPPSALGWGRSEGLAADDVDAALSASHLRYQCLGHLSGIRRAKQLVARRRLTEAWATGREDNSALALLLSSGDSRALRDAIEHQLAAGPVVELASFVRNAASLTLPPHLAEAQLVVAERGARLLDERSADSVLLRTLSEPLTYERLRTLARAVDGGSIAVQAEVSSTMRSSWGTTPGAPDAQAVAAVLGNIELNSLPDTERLAWSSAAAQLADETLTSEAPTGGVELVASVYLGLDENERDDLLAASLEALWRRDKSRLTVAAAFADAQREPTFGWAPLLEEAASAVGRSLDSARRGAYEFGGLDVAKLLAVLLQRTGAGADTGSSRDVLVEYLLSSEVSAQDRVGALLVLASSKDSLQNPFKTRLVDDLRRTSAPSGPFMGSKARLDAAILRLELAWEMVPDDGLLEELVRLLQLAPNEAATNMSLIAPAIGPKASDPFLAILVGLASHSDGTDLGYVGRSLSAVTPNAAYASVWAATMTRCLTDESEVAPRLTLGALATAPSVTNGPALHLRAVAPELTSLAREHPSRQVRSNASEVLAMVEELGGATSES